jgi:hypothetical protein
MVKWGDRDLIRQTPELNSDAVVVIPIYKQQPYTTEKNSLRQCAKVLGEKYDITIVCPDGLDLTPYISDIETDIKVRRIDPSFFKSQRAYSDLCETTEFYKMFELYNYMLIYQLDAWIFEDRLEYFTSMGYDYIGGPHLIGFYSQEGICGNGGFSLRKISKFIEVCSVTNFAPFILLEDRVFCENLKKHFNLAPVSVCREFSFHENPAKCLTLNNGKYPMGCHNIFRTKQFWKGMIDYGEDEPMQNITVGRRGAFVLRNTGGRQNIIMKKYYNNRRL